MDQSSESYSFDRDDDGFVAIANELLTKFRLSPIQDLSECTAAVLVALYEGILGDRLKGVIQDPITKEDEIHNMQLVIDSLEHDVLRIDLSHITGKAIVEGHMTTIRYLLEILAGLMEYVMEQIDSEGSTDVDDMLTSGTISSISHILQDELSSQSSRTRCRDRRRRAPATATRPDDDDTASTSTNELIRLGESAASAYGYNGSVETVDPDDHSSVVSSNTDRISASWEPATQHDDNKEKERNNAADSTQDLIREGESLARKYADGGKPTRDDEPERGVMGRTDALVSAQNASISTDSSASWPKHPQVPATKPPSEFDTIGLGLRARSYNVDREPAIDSVVRGIGRESEEITRPHQHIHTHHHYHQPVGIPRGTDPVHASSLPNPPSSSSSDIIPKQHLTAPEKSGVIGEPSTLGAIQDNVPHTDRSRPFTTGAIHGNVPFSDRDRSLTPAAVREDVPFTDRSRPMKSDAIRDDIPFIDRSRPLKSDAIRDDVPFIDRSKPLKSDTISDDMPFIDRSKPLKSDGISDDIPFIDRSRPLKSDAIRDDIPFIARSRPLKSDAICEDVPFIDRSRPLKSDAIRDDIPFIDRSRPLKSDAIRDDIPFIARSRPFKSDAIRDDVPLIDRSRPLKSDAMHDDVPLNDRSRPLKSVVIRDDVPVIDRSRPLKSDAIRDDVPFTAKGRLLTLGAVGDSAHVSSTDRLSLDPFSRDEPSLSDSKHPSPKHVFTEKHNLQPNRQISSITEQYSTSARADFDVGDEQFHPEVTRFQPGASDILTRTTVGNVRQQLRSDERTQGFAPLGDHPFSLASERYKTYLSSRLKESGFHPDTDRVTTRPPRLTDKYSKSFPPYETNDRLPSRPAISKYSSEDLVRDHSSQDFLRSRQSNLTLESEMDGNKYSSFERGLDVAERPGRRTAFEMEGGRAPAGDTRPRILKEILSFESDSDLEESTTHSDTQIDYSPVPSDRKPVEPEEHSYNLRSRGKRPRLKKPVAKQRSVLIQPPSRPNLKVRFEDALDADAKGEMGKIRRKLNKEKKTQERQKQVLQTVYASNLKEVKQTVKQQAAKRKQKAHQEDAEYKEINGRPQTSRYQPAKKYSAKVSAPGNLARQSRPVSRKVTGKRKRSASSSPTVRRHREPLHIGDDEILPTVMYEFPFLHVSPETAHNMWSKQMRQMEQLTKAGLDLPNKNKTQIKMEEAERRQEILLGIMKKELAHNQRMRDIKERRAAERTMASKAREQRQVTARARRYYDEFRLRAKSRMMKRRNREEQIFKKLFEDGLAIQKARIREMRKYAREKREQISARQQDEIDSLENYYRDQFSMLAETIAKERHELQVRDNAQNKVMEQMKREMRRKMEREIRDFQEQLYRDEDTEYFRQIEADRMRRQLQVANYKTQL